jgi:hypothetical protein
MQNILMEITNKCKLRDILFSRDWDAVIEPALQKEHPGTYQKMNQLIMEGNQGVIQRVE